MIEKARALIEYVEKYPWNNQYTRQARLEQENYVLEILNSIYREGFMDGEASKVTECGDCGRAREATHYCERGPSGGLPPKPETVTSGEPEEVGGVCV